MLSLDRLCVDKPNLDPYLYQGMVANPKDPHYGEALATAQVVADVLETAATQSTHFRDQWDAPEAGERVGF